MSTVARIRYRGVAGRASANVHDEGPEELGQGRIRGITRQPGSCAWLMAQGVRISTSSRCRRAAAHRARAFGQKNSKGEVISDPDLLKTTCASRSASRSPFTVCRYARGYTTAFRRTTRAAMALTADVSDSSERSQGG